jgi:hypothetical protein
LKRQTSLQKKLDYADALTCLRKGLPPKRLDQRRRDGSLPTKPQVATQVTEADVLKGCLAYLRRKGCLADRLNNGTFCTGGAWHRYGIVGAGDIVAIGPGGLHIEVECKSGKGGSWRVEQQRRADRVRRHGGRYVVVHSVEELEQWYESEVGDEPGSTIRERDLEDAGEEDPEG